MNTLTALTSASLFPEATEERAWAVYAQGTWEKLREDGGSQLP